MANPVELELNLIVRDAEIQPREVLNKDAVTQYAEDMLAGIVFPPVVVYHDGDRHWLSQGFHRCKAAELAEWETILADVRDGTRQDALWDACGSNREHDTSGLRRTNRDKKRAVEMALKARPELSNRAIAEQVGVTYVFVAKRREVVTVTTSSDRRTGRDGKSYPATNGKAKKKGGAKKKGKIKENGEINVEEIANPPEERGPDGGVTPQVVEAFAGRMEELKADPDVGWSSGKEGKSEVVVTQVVAEVPEPFALESAPAVIATEIRKSNYAKFNLTNEMVDWARWTWNPVTGCEHTCSYCYARDIANRFYLEKFEPTFRPERLGAPQNNAWPREADIEQDPVKRMAWKNVFVCSMADLFGRWVPDEWIEDVFASCRLP